MKIKVRISDGEVLEVQSHPTHILKAGEGEEIKEVQAEEAYAGMKLEGQTVRAKRPDEIPERQKTEREILAENFRKKEVLTAQEMTAIIKEFVLPKGE